MRGINARSAELVLWSAAALCFAATLVSYGIALRAEQTGYAVAVHSQQALATTDAKNTVAAQKDRPGEVLGQLRIPQLSLSVPVTAGVERSSLLQGVGHIDGTAFPGGLGTMALAGHRDTYLRPLEHVAKGMDVEVTSSAGSFHYLVDSSEVVTPDRVDVLAVRDRPELVLITCYPFHYIGPAPYRFVVHAHLVSLLPGRLGAAIAGAENGH